MIASIIIGIALIGFIFVISYIVSTQRKLVNLDELGNNALSQIGVQLDSRWDAVNALVQMTRQYSEHEYETLTATIAQRRISNVKTAEAINEQEGYIGQLLGRLISVSEQYPQLQATGVYQNTMNSIQKYEENVRMSRMIYNDTVTKINRMIRQWPSSFVANMLHFNLRAYLESNEGKREYPAMDGGSPTPPPTQMPAYTQPAGMPPNSAGTGRPPRDTGKYMK